MKSISRRSVLRGLGTAIALPWMESLTALGRSVRAAAVEASSPVRLAFLMVPNGAHMAEWTPESEGEHYDLPSILGPLAPVKQDVLVLSGLAQDGAAAHGDGGGDHARSAACFLTGVHPRKTHGANIRVGVSVDQCAAKTLGVFTHLPSLELGIERGGNAGNCDSGYSCAYSSNMSWRGEATPSGKEINPRLVFERLFTAGDGNAVGESQEKRRQYRKSVLDFVAGDAARLRRDLAGTDQQKLDEYLTGVREIEQRIEHASQYAEIKPPESYTKPDGIPDDFQDHVRLMCDLMAVAFQADVTRVCTFMFGNEASQRAYKNLGISDGHHEISHHGGNRDKQEKIARINRFHVEQFAYLLERLKGIREGDHTLLDQCMIVYGSGISDGNRHNHDNLPIVLAGRGGGSIKPGRHVRYPERTPLTNLYLSMLDRVGAGVERLGDSTGRLPRLARAQG
ncbi:MAG TPA: DUF1552 domain-containing protein [Pirellulales bacterium]|jgi:hypothetical protein|nr:DUF1552 domain-containing protein [Pirellulales bacterium]